MSYEFYDVRPEQIESITNLTRKTLLYSCDNPRFPLTVINGCITHTYPGTDDAGDKLQIILNTPIASIDSRSFLPLLDSNGSYLLDSNGKILEVPG